MGGWREAAWGSLGGAWLLAAATLAAQPLPQALQPPHDDLFFRRLVLPDFVPSQVITALAEDSRGFQWIGTQNGLLRYDGYEFRLFPAGAAQHGPSGAYVRALLAARDGRLWIGTFSGGLAVFDPRTETFRHFRHNPADSSSLPNDRVEGLAEDPAGGVWVATSGGLGRLSSGSAGFEVFRPRDGDPESLADERARGLLVDRAGNLWVGSRAGLQRYAGHGRFERVRPGDAWLAGQMVGKLAEDSRGRIWIGTTGDGAAVLDPRSGAWRRLAATPVGADPDARRLSHFWIAGFAQVGEREMWVGTFGEGADVVDLESLEVVARLRHDAGNPSSLGGDRLGALRVDRAGVVWLGAWGQGLARHDPVGRAWRALRQSTRRPADGLSHPAAVRALGARDGTLWVGTNGNGIDLLDAGLRRVGAFRPGPGAGDLADGSVTCLAQAPDGAIWVATLDGTLHRHQGGRFERWSRDHGLAGGQIRMIAFDAEGRLWAASSEGLTRLEPGRRGDPAAARVFRHRPDDPASLSGAAVEALVFDREGRLWVGTDHGLDLLDPATLRLRRLDAPPGRGLPNAWVRDLMVTKDGALWVATEGGAARLAPLDENTFAFDAIAPRLGRPPAPVDALIEDDLGGIWLGAGLRIDPHTWHATAYGPADGRDLRSFYIASREKLRDGRLLFGSPDGLQLVDPAALRPWHYAPPLVASRLRVGGEIRPGAAALERLVLQAGQRDFAVDFAALDFSAPEMLRYRRRLEGYDAAWLDLDATQRSAAYTNLPPGLFTLRIQGSNRAGSFLSEGLMLPVEVQPAFYQTSPFRILVLALAAAGLYGLVRWRVSALERRGRVLEALVRDRTRALEDAYHRLEEASLTDPLTGLRNRRFVDQTIATDVETVLRKGHEAPGNLIFFLLDLDHFKSVNDTYGHAAGDEVLRQIAEILRTQLRAADTVVRWGGEEFLVIARFVPPHETAGLAEKIRRAVADHLFVLTDGQTLRRTVSIGFALFPFLAAHPGAIGWEKVIHLADLALYAAKRRGRDRWIAIEPAGDAPPAAFDDPEAALDRGQLRLVGAAASTDCEEFLDGAVR